MDDSNFFDLSSRWPLVFSETMLTTLLSYMSVLLVLLILNVSCVYYILPGHLSLSVPSELLSNLGLTRWDGLCLGGCLLSSELPCSTNQCRRHVIWCVCLFSWLSFGTNFYFLFLNFWLVSVAPDVCYTLCIKCINLVRSIICFFDGLFVCLFLFVVVVVGSLLFVVLGINDVI